MSCSLTQSFTLGCEDSAGGIAKFFLGNMVTDFVATQNASGMVTAITGTGLEYYTYEAPRNTGNWTENITVSEENGTHFVQQTATVVLNKTEQAKRNEILLLAQAKLSVIVLDNNGKYWLLGQNTGVRLQTNESGSGTARGDRNGYVLTFNSEENHLAAEVDSSIISALLA